MTDEHWDVPDDVRGVWDALDGVAPEALPRAASARMERALMPLTPSGGGTPMGSRSALIASLVIVFAVGGAAGFGIGTSRARAETATDAAVSTPDAGTSGTSTGAPAPAGDTDGRQYLLLVHDNEAIDRAVRERGLATVVERYTAWARGLAEDGRLIGAEQLAPTTRWIGPSAPNSSSVSGYFLIRAADEDEAAEIARTSPHAELGGVVEVRSIVGAPPAAPSAAAPQDPAAPQGPAIPKGTNTAEDPTTPPTVEVSPQVPPIVTLGWMAGCWASDSGPSRVEELWTRPAGGIMLGVSRTVRGGGALVGFEHLLLQTRGDAALYRASPSGQATTEFTSTHLSDTLAVFENPEHDFPRAISYRRLQGDSLHARVEGLGADGSTTGFVIRYGRSLCP